MTGGIRFTETMRGQVLSPAPAAHTALALVDLQVDIGTAPPQGVAGMRGRITAGRVLVPCVCTQPLSVLTGSVEILRQTSERACEMRYDLLCALPPASTASDQSPLLRVQGVKDVSHQSGRLWPCALWSETTTLRLGLYAMPAATDVAGFVARAPSLPASPLLTGVVRIHTGDFLRQLLTLRGYSPLGRRSGLQSLGRFLRFFTARLALVYRRSSGRPSGT